MTAAAVPAGLLPREAAISGAINAAINAAISAGFFFGVFGIGALVPIWGMGHFVFDFVPQSLAVTFFASFVPSLLAIKAAAAGKLAIPGQAPSIRALFLRSVARGLAGAFIGVTVWAALLWALGVQELDPVAALALKVLYGLLLGAAVTYIALQRLFAPVGMAK